MAAIICWRQLQIKKSLQILLMGDQQPYCGSHKRLTEFATVLIAVLLMAVFLCSNFQMPSKILDFLLN